MGKTLIFIAAFSAFGCGASPTSISNNAPANATPFVVPTPAPVASRPPIKTFNGRGKVTKLNLELGTVELDHEEIKGSMPAMVMEFFVKDKSELKTLKIGDSVDFILEDDFGQERIIGISKAK